MSTESVASCWSASVTVRVTVYRPGSSNVCSTVWSVLSSVPSLSKSQLYPNGSTPPSAIASNSMVAGASPPVSFELISAVRGVVVGGSSVGGSSVGGSSAGGTCGTACLNNSTISSPIISAIPLGSVIPANSTIRCKFVNASSSLTCASAVPVSASSSLTCASAVPVSASSAC